MTQSLGVLVLALVLTACSSGPSRGGGTAAPATTTTAPALPGSFHDPVPDLPSSTVPTHRPPAAGRPRSVGNGGTTVPPPGSTATTATTSLAGSNSPTTGVPTTVPAGLPAEKCPEPKTCHRYVFGDGTPRRWRADTDGRVTIPYRINPVGATSISPEDIEGAIRAAFDTWERAAPVLRFVYEGRTTMQAVPGDGENVIAFNHASAEHTIPTGDKDGHLTEFDMLYMPDNWTWSPCRQADGSCTPHNVKRTAGSVTQTALELQSIATHAAGHALWLADMTDESRERYLTMNPGNWSYPPGSRYWSTLALGDVLGIRALYPCSCPLPPIYDP